MNNVWKNSEYDILRKYYPEESKQKILYLLPGRTWKTIKLHARKLKIKRLVCYKMPKGTNHFYFDKWSDEMAYVLGFIAADGRIKKSYFVNFHLSSKDLLHLEKIRNCLAPEKKIFFDKNKESIYLYVGSQYMCKTLKTLGIEERKSLTMKFPSMPRQHMSHFIRGYFDGDGCINCFHPDDYSENKNRWSVVIVGTQNFLSGVAKSFSDNIGIKYKEPKKEKDINLFRISYSTFDAIKVYKWLYNDATIYLERKYNKFQQLLIERDINTNK